MNKRVTTLVVLFLLAASTCWANSTDNSQAIAVKVTGSGQPVLYLPGFACPGSVWAGTMQHLEGPYQNHAVTYAGFGGVPAVAPRQWYAAVRQALIDYVTTHQLTNLTIIGHSMGGNLAVDIAAALPQTVQQLVLVDALPCMREVMMPGVPASNLQYDSPYNNNMLQMTDEAFTQTANMMAQNMTLTADQVPTLVGWMQQADRQTFVYGYTDLLKLDLRAVLDQITAKTLIIAAAWPTEAVAQATMTQQYEGLANKTITMVNNSRHFIMFDQPEWFYGQVNAFMHQ